MIATIQLNGFPMSKIFILLLIPTLFCHVKQSNEWTTIDIGLEVSDAEKFEKP